MSNAVKMQTVGEATSSVKGVFESTFSSLAKSLSLPQLRDSFFQNIIYILMVIVIRVISHSLKNDSLTPFWSQFLQIPTSLVKHEISCLIAQSVYVRIS